MSDQLPEHPNLALPVTESREEPRPPSPQPPSAPLEDKPPSPPPPPPPRFDPSRMIGIIKRKALVKELAAVYHSECLAYCQELLELQRKCEEPIIDVKTPEESRKETMRPPKRLKKTR
ncbi:hypothetical protein LguiA_024961 [Lonicera macranthoides]